MKSRIIQTLRASVTQGSADAYAEQVINTNIQQEGRLVYVVTDAVVEVSAQGTNDTIEIALCRQTKSSLPYINDPDVLSKFVWMSALTTSGATELTRLQHRSFAEPIPIAVPQLFFQLDSSGAAGALTAYLMLRYYTERVTEAQFFRIANQC